MPRTFLRIAATLALGATLCLLAAAGACAKTVDLTTLSPADLVKSGWTEWLMNNVDGAVQSFQIAVDKTDMTDPVQRSLRQQALYGLATVWNLRRPGEDRAKAGKLYQESIDVDPKSDTAAWSLLAMARMKHIVLPGEDQDLDKLKKPHPDYGPIREAYQVVIDRFPDHPAGQEAFLYFQSTRIASLDKQEAEQAVTAIDAFLAKHPGAIFESALLTLKSQAFLTLGRYKERLAAEIRAFETRPAEPGNPFQDNAQPYYQIACIAEFQVGDFATARKYYQKLVDEYPVDQRCGHAKAALKRLDQVQARVLKGLPPTDPWLTTPLKAEATSSAAPAVAPTRTGGGS